MLTNNIWNFTSIISSKGTEFTRSISPPDDALETATIALKEEDVSRILEVI